jgi:predicted molibdopterin-dependent oxidoreductase YjgC
MTQDLRIWKDVQRGQAFEIEVDGVPVVAYEGETVAAALMAAGIRTTNKTAGKDPRGVCCGIGLCYGCTMVIDGVPNTRTCQTLARPGMHLETQNGLQRWEVPE